jgi:ATP-dependent helicase HrpB
LEDVALLLAFANPGWIAKLRSNAKYSLANGSGAQLQEHDPLAHNTWLAIGNMQMINTKTLIRLAEPLAFAQLKEHFSHMFEEKEVVFWDNGKQSIAAQLHIRFGQIVIEKKPLKRPSSSRALEIWKSHIRQLVVNQGLAGLPLSEKARAWLAKVRMLNQVDTTFPNYSEEALKARLDDWLFPYIGDATTWKGLSALPFLQQFKSLLTYPQQQVLDEQVPDTFEIPTGRHVRIDYRDNGKAVVAVRIQEVYGLKQQPLILNNSLAITFELLSPAQRPIQTTDDIVSFFKGSYKEVQKEMKGRYPRHFWPDDPINSLPTATTKKRMEQRQR